MKKLMIFAAALAATAPALPVAASATTAPAATAPAPAESVSPVRVHDHLQTTLHGTSGPLVVLIPGMSTPGASWDGEVAALRRHYRLLVVQLRGFDGERGTANERPGVIDGVVADLAADLAARGVKPAAIVGHSLGGLVAMKFGLAHPGLAPRLLVVDALPFFGTVFGGETTLATATPRAAQMRDMMIGGADAMRAMGAKGTDSPAGGAGMSVVPANQLRIANWALRAEPLAVAQFLYEDVTTDLRADIARLQMPVTVLHTALGDHAAANHERYATDYAALGQVRLVPVPDSGHFIQLDQPRAFRVELLRLLAEPANKG